MRRHLAAVALAAAGLTACTTESSAVRQDREAADANLNRLDDAQPVPEFNFSQLRQNLIEINTAQADTTQTTSFFFNLGTVDPVASCPSIGFPIPSTMQLTNPWQTSWRDSGGAVVAQAEQTGVYTGDSSGTYVICIDATGDAYAFYWEGHVAAVTGPAEWDIAAKQIDLIGPPSFDFSAEQG